MAFKTATVNASDVAATLTDYPAYVDLSRLGITTLAEAQSVRVYADEAKTTEWAREIVSVTEMHVKIPSLTSTTDIYVDYDGIRADYAVGATYGRNAVWSDYDMVLHMDDETTSTITSSVDSVTFNKVSAGNPAEATGKIGNSQYNDDIFAGGATDYISSNDAALNSMGNGDITMQIWYKSIQSRDGFLFNKDMGSNRIGIRIISGKAETYFFDGSNFPFVQGTTNVNSGDWHMIHAVRDAGTTNFIYVNGSSENTKTDTAAIDLRSTSRVVLYGRSIDFFDSTNGYLDEMRVRNSVLPANWITTEYNNQNDEATFWGTWTDAGGGGGPTANNSARRQHLMMM